MSNIPVGIAVGTKAKSKYDFVKLDEKLLDKACELIRNGRTLQDVEALLKLVPHSLAGIKSRGKRTKASEFDKDVYLRISEAEVQHKSDITKRIIEDPKDSAGLRWYAQHRWEEFRPTWKYNSKEDISDEELSIEELDALINGKNTLAKPKEVEPKKRVRKNAKKEKDS